MQIEYGNVTRDIEDIEILKDMDQETANSLATGPQDAFFSSLDNFNSQIEYYGLKPIDVTNAWNWKPGTYPVIKEMMQRKLQMHKKTKGIYHFIERTRNYNNYMNYIMNQAKELERLKYELKQSGVKRDVDVDQFKEMAAIFVDEIIKQCNLAMEASNGKVDIAVFFNRGINARNDMLIFEILIKNIEIQVYDGRRDAKRIGLVTNDGYLRIISTVSFRHFINKLRCDINHKGKYISDLSLKHPYISQNGYNGNNYGAVCLDKYRDDVYRSFIKKDFLSLQHHLLSWSQYYHTSFSNPYNQINTFHIGLPEGYSEEYRLSRTNLISDCQSRLQRRYAIYRKEDDCKEMHKICVDNKCQLMAVCSSSNLIQKVLDFDKDTECQFESIIGYIAENTRSIEGNRNYEMKDLIEDWMGIGYSVDDHNSLSELNAYYIHHMKIDNHTLSTWESLLNECYYWEEDIYKDKDVDDVRNVEDVKEQMKAWATNPERRR